MNGINSNWLKVFATAKDEVSCGLCKTSIAVAKLEHIICGWRQRQPVHLVIMFLHRDGRCLEDNY